MHLSLATSFVALAVLAVAAPQPTREGTGIAIPIVKRSKFMNGDQTVNVKALNNHIKSVEDKFYLGFHNYEKNTGTKHPFAPKELGKRGVREPLTDSDDAAWYGPISVGTPRKHFTVVMDTGSSDLFLPGPGCSTCNGHRIWDPSSSSSSKDLGKSVQLSYGDPSNPSSVVVEEYTDAVSIAGLTANSQTLGAAKSYSSGFQSGRFPADGLMGMAFPSISGLQASPVFQTLLSQGKVTNPVFSFKLSSSGSELYIGGSNPNLYTGGFTYAPLTHQSFWSVKMDNVKANGKTMLSNIDSIIDTGTTLVLGEAAQVAQLYRTLGGKAAPSIGPGFYTFPCNSFPKISLTFGGRTFPISALNAGQDPSNPSQCVSGIVGDQHISYWIVGDVFLRGVYTKFDVGNSRVGFARLA